MFFLSLWFFSVMSMELMHGKSLLISDCVSLLLINSLLLNDVWLWLSPQFIWLNCLRFGNSVQHVQSDYNYNKLYFWWCIIYIRWSNVSLWKILYVLFFIREAISITKFTKLLLIFIYSSTDKESFLRKDITKKTFFYLHKH